MQEVAEISRPKDEILKEVEHAVIRGYSHIMLLGPKC